jgi:hypothetical protein
MPIDDASPIDVRVDQLRVVHAVKVIAGENQVVVGVVAHEVSRRLPHRVRSALVPVRVVGRLLGRQDFDEPLAEQVHPVGLRDVPVEGCGVELREHENPSDVRVQAVADGNVNQPVLAPDWHGWLRAVMCQREQPRPLAAAEDNREDFVVHRHALRKAYTAADPHVTSL